VPNNRTDWITKFSLCRKHDLPLFVVCMIIIFIHGLEEPDDWCMESYLSHTLIFMYVSLYVCLYVFIHAILTNYDVYVLFVTLFCRGCCTIVAAEFLLGSV
jgi:hypothetical protein